MEYGSAAYWHLIIESLRLSFADTEWYISDPDKSSCPVKHLLSDKYAEERSGLINVQRYVHTALLHYGTNSQLHISDSADLCVGSPPTWSPTYAVCSLFFLSHLPAGPWNITARVAHLCQVTLFTSQLVMNTEMRALSSTATTWGLGLVWSQRDVVSHCRYVLGHATLVVHCEIEHETLGYSPTRLCRGHQQMCTGLLQVAALYQSQGSHTYLHVQYRHAYVNTTVGLEPYSRYGLPVS